MTVPHFKGAPHQGPATAAPQEHPTYLWWQGKKVPWEEATVHVSALGWTSISAVFEGIRAYWNAEHEALYIFQLDAHLKRLFTSMKLMRMAPPYSREEIKEAALDLLRSNGFREDAYLYPLAYFASGVPGYLAALEQPGELLMLAQARPSQMLTGRVVHCCVSSWRRLSDNVMPPRAKMTTNYQNSRFASTEAAINGYDTALILNEQGKVAESPYACVFIIRDGVAITPPVTAGILESVTRDVVIALLQDELGVPTRERDVDRTELYVADEAFLVGTYAEVTPIGSVDRYTFGDGSAGPLTARLDRLYHDIVRGIDPRYEHWRTRV